MEILTDALAISGWALFGSNLPAILGIFSSANVLIKRTFEHHVGISFGLIAASIVLG